jgi:uncharacterized membrane protein YkoI
MKSWRFLLVVALLGGAAAVGSILTTATAGDDKDVKAEAAREAVAKKLGAALKKAQFSLVQACAAAERQAGGKAVAAQLEADDDDDGPEYEVVVAIVEGDKVTLREVDVDAVTGKVVAEDADKEDGDDGEDEEGDDDDDKKGAGVK